jgi:hypothetical protein
MTTPTTPQAACPQCGAPVSFRWAQAVQTTCGFCKSLLVRHDLTLELVGRQAEFPATPSPIQVGMEARWGTLGLVVVGRLTYEWARGRWTEWYCRVSDGTDAWLADAQLEYTLTRAVETRDALPDPSTLSAGTMVRAAGHRFVVTGLTQAQYVGTEGELPFSTAGYGLCWFADLLSPEGEFATLDGSRTPPRLYMGEPVSWDDLRATGARRFNGW